MSKKKKADAVGAGIDAARDADRTAEEGKLLAAMSPEDRKDALAADTKATAHGVIKYLAGRHGLTFDEACMVIIKDSEPLLSGIKAKLSVKSVAEVYLDRP